MMQGQAQRLTQIISAIDDAAERAWNQREIAKRHEALKAQRQKQF
jgi:hypothetical protein